MDRLQAWWDSATSTPAGTLLAVVLAAEIVAAFMVLLARAI